MIPVCVPSLGEKEREYVLDCLDTNWISSKGRYVEEFEEKFASYCGCRYGVSTTSGTTAIHLALASLGLKESDEVIIPTFTMIGSIFPILYCGAKPVLVDSEPETWNIDTAKIEEKITEKTKAIMPVHIYGHPCKMDEILKIAREHDLLVVEDAAEAHGAEYLGKKAGSLSDIGCFSFYANKIITCGEGGMMVTNNSELAEKAKSLKNLSFPKDKRVYLHSDVGFNYRMTNIQAAIGLAQLEKIDDFVQMRRRNASLYNDLLAGVNGVVLPSEKEWAKNVYWMYSILIDDEFGLNRDRLMEELKANSIETRPFFTPMNEQPVFVNKGLFKGEAFPTALEISRKGINLPSSSGLQENDIHLVCDSVKALYRGS